MSKSKFEDLFLKLDTRMDDIEQILLRQQAILEEHQRRSVANEEAVKILAGSFKPIENHVLLVNYTIKVITILGATLVALATIYEAVK